MAAASRVGFETLEVVAGVILFRLAADVLKWFERNHASASLDIEVLRCKFLRMG
jgi:hypothetical protein